MAVARVRQGGAWIDSRFAGKVRSGGAWIQFGPAGGGLPVEKTSLFTNQEPTNAGWSESGTQITLGTVINVDAEGAVTAGRWRFPSTAPAGAVVTFVLYDNLSGVELRRAVFTSPTWGEWNETPITPYPVASGASLVAAVHVVTAGPTVSYAFTPQAFAATVVNGSLAGPRSGADPRGIGNGRFAPVGQYPGGSYNSTSYFVDLVFEPTTVSGGSVILVAPDRPVLAGQAVGLDVLAANLTAGETISAYGWSVRSGSGSLSNTTTATPTYTPPTSGVGSAIVRATVTTTLGNSGYVDVRVGYGPNIVAAENQLPGALRAVWDLPAGSLGGIATLQGFCDGFSINKDETASFKIAQSDSAGWSAQVYRLGWYAGTGARLVATLTPTSGQLAASQSQPAPTDVDPDTSLPSVDCANWSTTLTWTPPSWAASGVYVLRLNRVGGGASHAPFIVRDDARAADLMFMPSDSTWQAYNAFGGMGAGQYAGNSLYFGTTVNQYAGDCARYVSYNRPVVNRGACDPGRDYGAVEWSNFFTSEYPMLRFLERNGIDYKAYGCIDAAGDATGAKLSTVKAALAVGHNEYWSNHMRSGWEAAKAAGRSLFFSAGNEVFWRSIGSNIDASGRPRTWECYKSTIGSRGSVSRPEWTGTWRDPDGAGKGGGQPENTLTGSIFAVNGPNLQSLVVPQAGGYSATPLWRHTSVATLGAGQMWTSPGQILGFEWDTYGPGGLSGSGGAYLADPHPDAVYCSDVTYTIPSGQLLTGAGDEYDSSGTATHRLVVHPGGGGSLIFGAGTINWSLGVDNSNTYQQGADNTSVVIQQATINMLTDMGAAPATLMSGLTAPTPVDWYGETPPSSGEAWALSTPTGGTDTADAEVSLAVPFGVTEAGEWTGVRVWVTPTPPSISPSVAGYNVDAGTRLVTKTYSEPSVRGIYHDVLFDAPVPVVPGVTYQAAIHTNRFGYTHRDALALSMRSPSERVYSGADAGTLALFRYESSPGTTPLASYTTSYAHMSPIVSFD
ncbi:N,N-dimethylformamidase beta subunit family domain-containing protein [Micromonospora arborensis]|uniref:N,N-dimethylformamidase beta subunit family domain-containing protein n=1 Tax=Micromonospora arborensis TaxID=2116518 RepID=UPI0037206B9A